MDRTEDEALVSYLIEHAQGTSELWLRRVDDGDFSIFQPLTLVPVSGCGTTSIRVQQISESIALDDWMADHFEVFSEGRTSKG